MSWKNWFIKAFVWMLKAKPSTSHRLPKHFLIVSTTALGDTLWATPALKALKQTYPTSSIDILTSSIGAEVLQNNPHLEEIFTLTSSTFFSLLRLFPKLKKKSFDAILIFHTSQRLILPFCSLLRSKQIIGTEKINKNLDFLLTKALKHTYQHEIARRLEIVKEVGAHVSDYALELPIQTEDLQLIEKFLQKHNIPNHIPLIGLHPGASNRFKQWPAQGFIEVGNRLVTHLGCQIFVSGNQEEAPLVFEIASKIPGAIPIAGQLKLAAFSALLKKMTIFITNDTGPMHIAFALKTPSVAIFGPTDPYLCGPFHMLNTKVLAVKKSCSPCLRKQCKDPFCLLALGPDKVYDAALCVIYQGKTQYT